ncbi:hypothetical protein [Bacillus sp. Au-Bac7]|uniref:hypothetical protein n=1 Tax=Bacillus sp. Au-Bac7 TaxID=2906458 RepID=UPI001E34B9DD|nr:hypothetical protein [Bacillus sp. Au-Bac7]MCE4049419.1 hypothetical protein [Bacillus sp. Au-Bac7]
MKLKALVTIAVLITLCFTIQSITVKASEVPSFNNVNGIDITDSEYNRLINLGFDDEQIEFMNAEEYEMNKGITGEVISTNKQYVKTTYIYEEESDTETTSSARIATKSVVEIEEPSIVDEKVEYLTKEEFENELANESGAKTPNGSMVVAASTDTGTSSTSYKILTVKLVKISSKEWKVQTTLEWKKIPSTRETDLIGAAIRYPDNFIINHTKRYGSQYYQAKGVNAKQQSKTERELITYAANSGKWLNDSYKGDALTQNLRNNYMKSGYNYRLNALKNTMYFHFNLNVKSYPYNTVQVRGNYAHQVNSSPLTLSNISLTWGAPSFDFSASEGNKFDTPISAQAYVNY